MNAQNLIESIRQVFPNVSRTQIRLDLDTAQKLLADETESLVKTSSLASPSTNVAWSLPSDFAGFLELNFYDTNGEPEYLATLNYKWEIGFNKFFIYSTESTPITGISPTYAYLTYRSLPATISTEATTLEMTEHYRDALESYVLAKYFGKFPIPNIIQGNIVEALNFQAANWHKTNYEQMRIKIKRLFNSRVKTDNEPINYPDAGKYQLPKRVKDTTTGSTVSIAALTDLYTKYAYYKITSGGSISPTPTLQINYATISCSVAGDTITLTSTGDFDAETIINFANQDCTYVYNSSSSIVITAPTGWTNASFEMYERD
jgi:hypothetical protein